MKYSPKQFIKRIEKIGFACFGSTYLLKNHKNLELICYRYLLNYQAMVLPYRSPRVDLVNPVIRRTFESGMLIYKSPYYMNLKYKVSI